MHGLGTLPSYGSWPRRRTLLRLRTAARSPCSSSCSERARRRSAPLPTCEAKPHTLAAALALASRPSYPTWPTTSLSPSVRTWVGCVRPPRSSPCLPRPIVCSCSRILRRAKGAKGVKAHSALSPVGSLARLGRAPLRCGLSLRAPIPVCPSTDDAFGPSPSCSRRIPEPPCPRRWSWSSRSRRYPRLDGRSFPSGCAAAHATQR
jgi:hypothetical protein